MYFRALSRVFARYLTVSGPIQLRSPCPNFLSVGSSAIGNGHFRLFTSQIQENPSDQESNQKQEEKLRETLLEKPFVFEKSFVFDDKNGTVKIVNSKEHNIQIMLTAYGYIFFSLEEATVLSKKLHKIIKSENAGNRYGEKYKIHDQLFKLRLNPKRLVIKKGKLELMLPPTAVPLLKENLTAILKEYKKLKEEGKLP
uniref:Uncharacterized protein n=1 Tax=Acrobeloides nanus TaxID=290746 RepID=A0A914CVD9_9BILA